MIHIAVPDTQTLTEVDTGRKYEAYNFYVNGAYHASVRYSSLLLLHEKLQKIFGSNLKLAEFPAKKFFMDRNAIIERKNTLGTYFRSLAQQPAVAHHPITEKFFLSFQVDSFRPSGNNVSVDVYLPDGTFRTVRYNVENNTGVVLNYFAEMVGIESEYAENFGLFIARKQGTFSISDVVSFDESAEYPDILCVRLLKNFESPYISLQLLNRVSAASGIFYRIVIRKMVWSPAIECALFNNSGAVMVLYKQALCELLNGKLKVKHDSLRKKMNEFEDEGRYVEFLRLCHMNPTYGYEYLEDCSSDYPHPETHCKLKIGRRCIVLEYHNDDDPGKTLEAIFYATKIRSWTIAHVTDNEIESVFEFDYCMSKEYLEKITLRTKQAILISLIMQSFASEILREPTLIHDNGDSNRSNEYLINGTPTGQHGFLISSNTDSEYFHATDSHVADIGKLNTECCKQCVNNSESNRKISKDQVDTLSGTGRSDKCNCLKSDSYSLEDLFVIISSKLPANCENMTITDADL